MRAAHAHPKSISMNKVEQGTEPNRRVRCIANQKEICPGGDWNWIKMKSTKLKNLYRRGGEENGRGERKKHPSIPTHLFKKRKKVSQLHPNPTSFSFSLTPEEFLSLSPHSITTLRSLLWKLTRGRPDQTSHCIPTKIATGKNKMNDKKHFLDHHHLPPFSPSPSPSPSPAPTSTADDPTVELPRRRRGRPPGSKNKPKPPSSVSFSPSPTSSASPLPPNPLLPSMRTLLLQIDPDHDVVDSVTRFCRNKSISLSLLSASGTLSHFTLHHPSSPPSALTFRGRFDILSLSATIVSESNPGAAGVNNSTAASSSFYLPSGFAVTVSGPQGQVVGGAVGGPLIAAGPVFVVAASFDKPSYHRLPEIEEDVVDGEVAGSGVVGGGFGGNIGSVGSDVVWAPVAARPPY